MRIAIAEDSTLLREGIAQLLVAEGHTITAAVDTADELIAAITTTPPDLVIVDVRMPPDFVDEGVRAALEIRTAFPHVSVIVLSQHVERRHARELLDGRGGVGYLLKDRVSDISGFLEAIQRVADGGTAFDPEVIRQLLAARVEPDARLATLTDREKSVLELIAQGQSNAGIAKRLFVSQSGVEKHINTIFTKLEIAPGTDYNRRVLAALAFLDGSGSPS
ncbi:response regulator transcription factor [Microbacterium sp. CIAB417]|uniref:response regulator transcription factor n=1 Tax=Microbacterium sp. CIAB417 TaxID=2860287 RepID=UPI001FAC91F2|nr:response regulator transcription factor [Microbacterium sp. CIAB417]